MHILFWLMQYVKKTFSKYRIEEGSFKEVPLLQHLDLSINRFSSLHQVYPNETTKFEKLNWTLFSIIQEIFSSLKHLKSLNLAENQLEDINGLLTTQINLKWLNISNNKLAWFDYAFIPPGKNHRMVLKISPDNKNYFKIIQG